MACLSAALLASVVPPAVAAGGGLAAYEHQRLVWAPCPGIDNPEVRCASVRVPLDYAHPAGRAIEIVVSRRPASDPARRRGVLLTTGGGPGGPGVPLPDQLSHSLDAAVLAAYDLVGFDMRFVERSTPITCGRPTEEPGGFWVRVDGYQPFGATVAQARQFARDCARNAGWALPHATTANAARDIDIIRAALGEPRISYLGGSYAALLGAVYATLFPGRVDRLVLDSPPDSATIWRQYELDRTAAMEDNYGAFVAWVAANDAAYGFGATPDAAGAALTSLFRRAATEPIVAGDHAWTLDELGYLFVLATFFEQLWPVVALDVAAIRSGSPPPIPLDIRASAAPGTPGVPADNHTAVNQVFRCADNAWPRDLRTYRRDLAVLGRAFPVYGPANANVGPCAFWPSARDNTVAVSADPAGGALVLAARHDAAVPPANSLATRAAIRGARLVTVDRRVHVPLLSGQATPCMTAAVTDYLVTGALPAGDLAC
ncbi:alpha/beta fold hydrolase [Dactylosporangium aurantiacum]|uniref:Alpha/beta fold hydrolase n=1 Tax=Dactylosporangium aurantiacum TaxID=35754 RepID=A0A9Q9IG94_9ACTN|nr:alpha/beta fold hydrolase [Dactylosporangium aurantiacum]MDG6108057.1 alpha/beta fold hydrolase [Dactylosporangium aurantiacum]UWZ53690.1 alpha/beta fold hydrolase [Dactylosporangium aurantiacum]